MTYIIINAAIVALVWTGALRVDGGAITQGEVVALISYMSQILVELVKLANLIININKSVACWNRIAQVLDIEPSVRDAAVGQTVCAAGDGGEMVRFSHVGLTYANAGDAALTDIDFSAARGETIGIIGGTGSGKSSVVNLIPRFYEATEGQVCVGGVPVQDRSLEELRGMIGVVPQKAVLFAGTIRENLLWGNGQASEEELLFALQTAQAGELVESKEGGLDYRIEQGGRNLSGGQRQRLTIARALVRRPQILILDDSASALDYATDARLRSAIASLGRDMTVFIVSQRAASVQHADQILVMDDGRVVGHGTHEELLAGCTIYQEIYDSQFAQTKAKGVQG